MERIFYIFEQWSSNQPLLLGKLFSDSKNGREIYSFEFDNSWLDSHRPINFDPDLNHWAGRQYLSPNKPLFGFLSDSCPNRWGRLLMQRKEAEIAKRHNRHPKKFTELDYLIRVNDHARLGAIRISREPEGRFISDDKIISIENIRDLEEASRMIDNKSYDIKSLNLLFSPGSSLGGARPKASVVDVDGSLWIAKFPSKNDETNSGAWEMVCHELMNMCRIKVCEARICDFSKYGATYLSKRFDRNTQDRIHFSSAMNLLGFQDGDSNAGYLDLVSFIKSSGANPNEDLNELYRRMAFNMIVHNTDDHLRNHGFLLEKKGWRLSPAFDVNPVPFGNQLSLNISQNSKLIDIDNALSVCHYFELDVDEAKKIYVGIEKLVKDNWKLVAKKCKISNQEIEFLRPAFP